ncbi:hypothetical protein ACOMHN_005336 [Nucella lapillus]
MRHRDITVRHRDITLRHRDMTVRHRDITVRHRDITLRHRDITVRHKDITFLLKVTSSRCRCFLHVLLSHHDGCDIGQTVTMMGVILARRSP